MSPRSLIRFITSRRRARNSARRSASEIFGAGGAMRQISGGPRAAATWFCKFGQTARSVKATVRAADTALKRMRRRFTLIIHLCAIRFVSGDLDQQPQQYHVERQQGKRIWKLKFNHAV